MPTMSLHKLLTTTTSTTKIGLFRGLFPKNFYFKLQIFCVIYITVVLNPKSTSCYDWYLLNVLNYIYLISLYVMKRASGQNVC